LYDENGECIIHQLWFGRIIAYASKGADLNLPKSLGGRNFLHITDASQILYAVARKNVEGFINIAHPESFSYKEIALKAYSIFNKGGNIREAEDKKPFREVRFPCGLDAFERLEYYPRINMAEGILMIREGDTAKNFGPMDVR